MKKNRKICLKKYTYRYLYWFDDFEDSFELWENDGHVIFSSRFLSNNKNIRQDKR